MRISAKRGADRIPHPGAGNLLASFAPDVTGADTVRKHLADRGLNPVSLLIHVEGIADHHGGGFHSGDRVRDILPGNIRGRPVRGLKKPGALLVQRRGGEHTDGPRKHRGFVREDVAEEVSGEHHVKLSARTSCIAALST